MKTFCILTLVLFGLFTGCNGSNSKDSDSTSEISSHNNHEEVSTGGVQGSDNSHSGLVTLSNCKEIYDNNLQSVKWVTVTNNTDHSIKGLDITGGEDGQGFKFRIKLGPNSSKRISTSKIDCNTSVKGVIYQNGDYESGPLTIEELMGTNSKDRMDYQAN